MKTFKIILLVIFSWSVVIGGLYQGVQYIHEAANEKRAEYQESDEFKLIKLYTQQLNDLATDTSSREARLVKFNHIMIKVRLLVARSYKLTYQEKNDIFNRLDLIQENIRNS